MTLVAMPDAQMRGYPVSLWASLMGTEHGRGVKARVPDVLRWMKLMYQDEPSPIAYMEKAQQRDALTRLTVSGRGWLAEQMRLLAREMSEHIALMGDMPIASTEFAKYNLE